MQILVTGGSGVIGVATVRELHRAGHSVRVLTRHAERDRKWRPEGVEAWAGDISNAESIEGAANDCEAVVHVAGIVDETPKATFQAVNVDGTRYVAMEAERAGIRKLIYISSLGADRGESAYHKSKFVAEDVVRAFTRDWVVLRPGAVYGPGDEHLSVLLRLVRTLPVIPTIGNGDQQFQPIWHEDFAKAIRVAVEQEDVRCVSLDVAGEDLTSQNDLVARMRRITGRSAVQAPVPEFVASWGLRALDAVGVEVPFTEAQLEMLTEGNVIPPDGENALTTLLGISPTPLDVGLRMLADAQPEQLPSQGVGRLKRKRFWVDIANSPYDAARLFDYLRTHFAELMPSLVETRAEPGATCELREGESITLEIPLRGHVQVRVVESRDNALTMLTLQGHPIAGAVRFVVTDEGLGVRFEIQVYDRPANVVDEVLMRTVGEWLQEETWVGLASNVARAAGGASARVKSESEELDQAGIDAIDTWARELAAQASRKSTSGGRS